MESGTKKKIKSEMIKPMLLMKREIKFIWEKINIGGCSMVISFELCTAYVIKQDEFERVGN